jgi:hypothetical protein
MRPGLRSRFQADAQLQQRQQVAHGGDGGRVDVDVGTLLASNTKVPMPCRVSTSPAACRREMASRTTVRDTPWVCMISDSVGSLSPGLRLPLLIIAVSAATTSCDRLWGCGAGAAAGWGIATSISFIFSGALADRIVNGCDRSASGGVNIVAPSYQIDKLPRRQDQP